MLKHANYDIENGLKSLKVGFEAIFNALINKEIEVYQTEFPLSYSTVDLGLELCYDEDTNLNYAQFNENIREKVWKLKRDKGFCGEVMYTEIEDTTIIVIFDTDRTVFYRIPSKT